MPSEVVLRSSAYTDRDESVDSLFWGLFGRERGLADTSIVENIWTQGEMGEEEKKREREARGKEQAITVHLDQHSIRLHKHQARHLLGKQRYLTSSDSGNEKASQVHRRFVSIHQ